MDPKPVIISPVSRILHASDPARTAAFYRDVLGFEVREQPDPMEAFSGPARIQFGGKTGSAVLFFQTNDVVAMHTQIAKRGGVPSELQKVNFLKMQMFEVRDPEGHALWFGQSFADPQQSPPPTGLLREALPELPFNDVAAAISYYQEVLGFRINYSQDDLGVMYRDRVTILLIARTPQHAGIGSVEFYVRDADALYAELKAKGARLQSDPVSRPWGLRDFHLLDLENNRITFAQTFE